MRGNSVVLFVDPDPGLRKLLRSLTRDLQRELVCFSSAEELLSSALFAQWANLRERKRDDRCDREIACLVSELRLPGMDGVRLLEWLRQRHLLMPLVFVTSCGDLSHAAQVLKQGALEVLPKPVTRPHLLNALEAGIRFSPLVHRFELACRQQSERLERLSDREREVLARVLCRMPLKQIAVELGTSPHTVRNQRQSILQKLDAADDADLLLIAMSVRMHDQGLHWPLLPVLSRSEFGP